MTIDIDELRRLEAAATPGEWIAEVCGDEFFANVVAPTKMGNLDAACVVTAGISVENARHIVAARNALPHLLSFIDKLLTHERCHAAGIDANARELIAMDAKEIARLRARVRGLEANAADLEQALENMTSQRDFVLGDRDGLRAALAEAKRKADEAEARATSLRGEFARGMLAGLEQATRGLRAAHLNTPVNAVHIVTKANADSLQEVADKLRMRIESGELP